MHILPRLPAKTNRQKIQNGLETILPLVMRCLKWFAHSKNITHRRHRRHRLRGGRGRNLATKTIVLVIFTDFLAAFSTLELEKRDAAEFVLQKRPRQLVGSVR